MLSTYRESLTRIQLSGPTLFAPVISQVSISPSGLCASLSAGARCGQVASSTFSGLLCGLSHVSEEMIARSMGPILYIGISRTQISVSFLGILGPTSFLSQR